MKLTVIATVLLTAGPALADFQCTIARQCGGGTCEDFTGGPMTLKQNGDVWVVALSGTEWQAFPTSEVTPGGALDLVITPQDGLSGLVTVMQGGQVAFTVHAASDAGLVAITGEGTCTSEAG